MIDLNSLPREVKDRLEMKCETDPTFFRAIEEDYTDELFETLETRRSVDVQHSYLASVFGTQGSGKCILGSEKVYCFRNGWKLLQMRDLKKGDILWGSGYKNRPQFSKILNVSCSIKNGWLIKTKRSHDVICSEDHKFAVLKNNKLIYIKASDLVKGDSLLNYKWNPIFHNGIDELSYSAGFITGAYLADGCISYTIHCGSYVIFTKKEGDVLDAIQKHFKKCFGFKLYEYFTKGKNAKTLKCNDHLVIKYFESFNHKNNKSFIPYEFNFSFLKGLLDGYVNCDSAINCSKSKTEMQLMTNSKDLAFSLQRTIAMFGFCASFDTRILKSGEWSGNVYYKLKFGRCEGERFFSFIDLKDEKLGTLNKIKQIPMLNTNADIIKTFSSFFINPITDIINMKNNYDMIDIETETSNFFLANGLLTHNSYGSLALSGFLDPRFSIDKIYFDYSKLVYDRRSLKPHSAILVDEQSEAYGIDSMRVSIILKALKEQLRKKSIHFFFCSPTLKPEYETSMYVFETMFLDHKTKTCFAAYKTRDLLTLGYVRIPHPLQFISKDLLAAYEEKKDVHLDQLTGKIQIDEIEEAAKRITQHPLFISAEKLYKNVRGYIPTQMLIQLINKIYPEFKANVMAMEIASRVKLNKEMTGEWSIVGQKKGGERNG